MSASSNTAMFFFGKYLLEKGVISQEDLDSALKFQEEGNRRIGDFAVEKELLTQEQVEIIFEEQKHIDRPFGAIALDLKLLSRNQLDDLLFSQAVHSTHLGEALLMQGALTPEQQAEELHAFQNAMQARRDELQSMLAGFAEKDIYEAVVDALDRAFLRFADRRIDPEAVCEKPQEHSIKAAFDFEVLLEGKGPVSCSVLLSEPLAIIVSQEFESSEKNECDEECLKRVGEFMSIIERYLCLTLKDKGFTVEHSRNLGGRVLDPGALPQNDFYLSFATPGGALLLRVHVQGDGPDPCAPR